MGEVSTSGRGEGEKVDLDLLRSVERRVLWLATRMIDWVNRGEGTKVKVGGHQASCASMVSIMTGLWFSHISGADKVSVKPHASPVYHAIKYLTGELDKSYLTKLRQFRGLQAYPSRTKDPDVSDYSTGSVGLGAVAPLFSAVAHRYISCHFGEQNETRFIATVGDAELDEGNVWEAVCDPITKELGNFTMVVDLNRQSLDRVVPDIAASRLQGFFSDAGWHVAEAKYGSNLTSAFSLPGGEALRNHIDLMANEAYQTLFALEGSTLREEFLRGADSSVKTLTGDFDDLSLKDLVTDLGGHDLGLLVETFRECDAEESRPSVVFAYTIKGWGLPMAGHPLNHSALMTPEQIDVLRGNVGLTIENEWERFPADSPEGQLCEAIGARINNTEVQPRPILPVPTSVAAPAVKGEISTQQAFGRTLVRLARVDEIGDHIVTVSPDVAISTNLGGWINKVGVFSHTEKNDSASADQLIKWISSPDGQHLELGISEMNLFLLLGQLGLSHDHHGQHLLPIGTVYDPFVLRGLDALIYSLYNNSRFVIAGTPSGVTLSPEGGAHQSTITASVGAELPGLVAVEPAFATEVEWLLCDSLDQLSQADGESTYLRLSTRPIDQTPFGLAVDRHGLEVLRDLVLKGGYRLIDKPPTGRAGVTLITTGVMAPEALGAAAELEQDGIDATVLHLTSPDRIYRSWKADHSATRAGARPELTASHLHRLIPETERSRPIVSVHDAASHSLAWIGSVFGTSQIPLGVDRFGESGSVEDLHRATGISSTHIVAAVRLAIAGKVGAER